MAETYSAGIVTAYGAARRGGYTGTYEEFCIEQAGFAEAAQQVRRDKESVEQTVETFSEETVPEAVQSVTGEGTRQIGLITDAGDEAVEAVGNAGTANVSSVNRAGLARVEDVNNAGTTQVGNVNQAGVTQVQAVEDKGEEVLQSIPADYTALANAVNDPVTGLDTKAPAITNTASGAIASFSDGADSMPVKQLVVNVEPQQDLHGYENPWPAGGGKNIANLDTVTLSTARISGDLAELTITQSGNFGTLVFNIKGKANTVYTCSAKVKSTSTGGPAFFSVGGGNYTATTVGNTYIGQVTTDANGESTFNLRPPSASGEKNSAVFTEVQVEEGTTKTNFAPYSNICPISGWTGAEIEWRGKNWFDVSTATFSTANGSGDTDSYTINQTANYGFALFTLKVKPNTNYHLRAVVSAARSVYRVDNNAWKVVTGTELDATFQTGSTGSLVLSLRPPSNSGVTNSATYTNIMLEEGTVATSYEPFQSKEISVTFPTSAGTVYGGMLTINPDRTGTLVVDRADVDMGTLDWSYNGERFQASQNSITTKPTRLKGISDIYPVYNGTVSSAPDKSLIFSDTSTLLYVKDSAFTDAAEFKAGMSGHSIVYLLANPITYTLTPEEVSGILTTLYGTNNIWADCGDVDVTYVSDTKLFIEQLTQPTEDDMTADHAISSGTFFMIGNTLYLATSQIAAGATITPGTNATQLSLADALNQLNA